MNLYNNKFFDYFYNREIRTSLRQLENQGASVSDNYKHEQYVKSNAKFSFWILIGITIFIIYQIISRIFKGW